MDISDSFSLPLSAYNPKQKIFYEYKNTKLQSCDFKAIAANTDLFWMAFCKTVAEMKLQASQKFVVKMDRECITVESNEKFGSTINNIREIVEKIRVFFQDSLAGSRCITFLPIFIDNQAYFRRMAPLVNLADFIHHPDYSNHHVSKSQFIEFIRPVIPELAKQLGMSCSISPHEQKIRTVYVGPNNTTSCEAITIGPEII